MPGKWPPAQRQNPQHLLFGRQAAPNLLTQAKVLLVRGQKTGRVGDLKQAAELLRTLLLKAERFRRVTLQIEILVLQAIAQSAAQDAQGDVAAEKTLLRALALGEPEGYRRVYLDEGWQLADLLRQCRSVQQEYGIAKI
jgi:hypothetical protein